MRGSGIPLLARYRAIASRLSRGMVSKCFFSVHSAVSAENRTVPNPGMRHPPPSPPQTHDALSTEYHGYRKTIFGAVKARPWSLRIGQPLSSVRYFMQRSNQLILVSDQLSSVFGARQKNSHSSISFLSHLKS